MATCAQAVQNPDGSLSLVLQPSQTDLTQCSFAVLSGTEISNLSLFFLSPSDALTLLSPICLVLAVAWGYKVLKKSFDNEVSNDF